MPYKIKLLSLELQDYETIMLDSLTRHEYDNLFRMYESPRIPYSRRNEVMFSITIEMDMNVEFFER